MEAIATVGTDCRPNVPLTIDLSNKPADDPPPAEKFTLQKNEFCEYDNPKFRPPPTTPRSRQRDRILTRPPAPALDLELERQIRSARAASWTWGKSKRREAKREAEREKKEKQLAEWLAAEPSVTPGRRREIRKAIGLSSSKNAQKKLKPIAANGRQQTPSEQNAQQKTEKSGGHRTVLYGPPRPPEMILDSVELEAFIMHWSGETQQAIGDMIRMSRGGAAKLIGRCIAKLESEGYEVAPVSHTPAKRMRILTDDVIDRGVATHGRGPIRLKWTRDGVLSSYDADDAAYDAAPKVDRTRHDTSEPTSEPESPFKLDAIGDGKQTGNQQLDESRKTFFADNPISMEQQE